MSDQNKTKEEHRKPFGDRPGSSYYAPGEWRDPKSETPKRESENQDDE